MAVFPFEDLSSQKEINIFCRYFSEDLITELSRFRQLSVIRYPTGFSPGDIQNLSSSLKPAYFVQGTFRADNEIVKINVQLYNSENRRLVWGDRLEGHLFELGNATATVLGSILGENAGFSMSSPTALAGTGERSFSGFKEAAKENPDSRVTAGIHFRFACEAGMELGDQIGQWVINNHLKPLK